MADTKRTAYKNDWQKEHTDRISLTVQKGQKAQIEDHAKRHEESLNGFINRAIKETIEHDKQAEVIAECARDAGKTIEEVQQIVDLHQAIKLIESQVPGFEELWKSGQLPSVISHRIIELSPNGSKPSYR